MDDTIFKTDKTLTRMQRRKLFFSRPYLCFTVPEAGGSSDTPTEPGHKEHACSGGFRAVLGPPARASLETAGDNKGVGQNGWVSRVPGVWQGGRPVDTWSAGGGWGYRTSAEKEDGQGKLDLRVHLKWTYCSSWV